MQNLADLIASGEDRLIATVIGYASERGYAKYTPSDRRVWCKSLQGFPVI
jgi:hypothetical protein